MRLTERPAWRALAALAAQPLPHLRELVHEPGRGDYARLSAAGIGLDSRGNASTALSMKRCWPWRKMRASRRSATPCSPAKPSTPPKAAPCCTSRYVVAPTPIHPGETGWRRKSMRN